MKVVCFGDSNTWGYDPYSRAGDMYPAGIRWTDILQAETGWTVVNQGINGREVPEEAAVMSDDTDLFLVMLGTNDLLQLDTPEAAAQRMEGFLSGVDPKKVGIIAPPPMVWGEWVQDEGLIADCVTLTNLYRDLSDRLGVRFFDASQWGVTLACDGVHFTKEGHRAFAMGLLKEILS